MSLAPLPRRTLLAGALALPALQARAQPVPRLLRLIVPFPGGGTMDAQARLFAPLIAARLQTQVIIDNKPGAGTVIGTQEAARATDGATILMASNSFAINPTLHGNLPYDIFRDFAPLSETSVIPHALVVHPDVPARNLAEFAEAARSRVGGLSYASYGTGTSNHLNTELLARRLGVELTHVPYRGIAQWFPDLTQNRVQFVVANLPEVVPSVREGKLRAIAVLHPTRVPSLPDTPTLAEQGIPDLTSNSWFGIVAPVPSTPERFRTALEAALRDSLVQPELRARLAELWIDPLGTSSEEFGRHLRAEFRNYAEAIRPSGARPA